MMVLFFKSILVFDFFSGNVASTVRACESKPEFTILNGLIFKTRFLLLGNWVPTGPANRARFYFIVTTLRHPFAKFL
jgi:hypothetical protein